ncbi:MAG: hypothetical protein M1823_004301 [Watsoniomyces obsoletus]|nr:MAG: hypothetical protein M1823_004301 [Watsoniomyces obsoletus]
MASHGVPRASGTRQHKSEAARQKELQKIQEYKSLVEALNVKANVTPAICFTSDGQISAQEYTTDTLSLTTKLLKLNPEYYTVWNHRRRVLCQGLFGDTSPSSTSARHLGKRSSSEHDQTEAHNVDSTNNNANNKILDLIRTDLNFLVPLLRQFPKCYWIWNHRVWLLEQSTERLPRNTARSLWEEELGLVSKMLALDGRNFHGWGYRRIVVKQLESEKLAPEDADAKSTPEEAEEGSEMKQKRKGKSMVESEFQYTWQMIRTNLSNFSAWHYRANLIPRLLDERGGDGDTRRKFIDEDLTSEERQEQLHKQLQILKEMLEGADPGECKWIYEALVRYSNVERGLRGGNDGRVEGGKGGGGGGDEDEDEEKKKEKEKEKDQQREWLNELKKLDPLRRGRWEDMEKALLL